MELPCKHIFCKRSLINNILYDKQHCDRRWTRKFYIKSQSIFQEHNEDENENATDVHIELQRTKKTNLLTTQKKFRKASILGTKLAELLSLSSQFNFDRKMEQLKQIICIWSERKEFLVEQLNNEILEIELNIN